MYGYTNFGGISYKARMQVTLPTRTCKKVRKTEVKMGDHKSTYVWVESTNFNLIVRK
jgi:hypothetical protein